MFIEVIVEDVEANRARSGAITAVTALILVAPGCPDLPLEEVEIDPSQRTSTATLAPPASAMRFSIAAMVTPEATYRDYALLIKELGSLLGKPISVTHGRSYKSVNDQLVSGKLDAAFICTGGYLDLLDRGASPEILAVPVVNGETVYRSLVIVKRKSRYRSFDDLRGSRFAFTDPLSNTGYLYPTSLLRQRKADKDRFFASYTFLHSHDRAIRAVTSNLRDAAAVDSLIFQFMVGKDRRLSDKLRVLHRSPAFGIPPIVAGQHTTAAQRSRWRAALVKLAARPRARAAMRRLRIDRFAVPAPGLYDATRKLYAGMR